MFEWLAKKSFEARYDNLIREYQRLRTKYSETSMELNEYKAQTKRLQLKINRMYEEYQQTKQELRNLKKDLKKD